MPVLELPATSVGQLKQTPFSSKMAFHTLSRVLYPSPSQRDVGVYVSVPNNEQIRFSHEVFVVGTNVNAFPLIQSKIQQQSYMPEDVSVI